MPEHAHTTQPQNPFHAIKAADTLDRCSAGLILMDRLTDLPTEFFTEEMRYAQHLVLSAIINALDVVRDLEAEAREKLHEGGLTTDEIYTTLTTVMKAAELTE